MTLSICPLNADTTTIASWRYEAPYDFYNHSHNKEEQIAEFLRPEYNYHAIEDGSRQLIGYFCFGPDARVPGCEYDANVLDLGMGLHPALTGQGLGGACLCAILQFIKARKLASSVRATVAVWNKRAIQLCLRAGFQEITICRAASGIRFQILGLNFEDRTLLNSDEQR